MLDALAVQAWPRAIGYADLVLALAIVGFAVAERALGLSAPLVFSVLQIAVCVLLVIVSHSAPVPAALALAAAWSLTSAGGGPWVADAPSLWFAAAVVSYRAGTSTSTPLALAGGSALVLTAAQPFHWERTDWGFALWGSTLVVGLPWVAGRVAGRSLALSAALRRAAAALEREEDTRERLALAAERVRLAGDVHDATGQALGGMVMQAAAAEQLVDIDPARAGETLSAIGEAGRAAIADLQRTLRALRTPTSTIEAHTAPAGAMEVFAVPARFPWPRRLDGILAVAAFVVGAVGVADWWDDETRLTVLGLLPLLTLPVAARRHHPVLALWTICAGALAGLIALGDAPLPFVVYFVLCLTCYSLGAYHCGAKSLLMAAVPTAGITLAYSLPEFTFTGVQLLQPLDVIPFAAISVVAPVVFGRIVSANRNQAERLRRLVSELERRQEDRARLAVLEERTRVARELHDSVGHAVSLMVLQAGAGAQVIASDPHACKDAVRAVRVAGRAALAELSHLLGVLDPARDAETSHAALPSLSRLDTLLGELRGAGLPVSLEIRGSPRPPIPYSLDISAYRIIQEALTNVLKHAGPVATSVTVTYTSDRITLEVRNAAPLPGPRPAGGTSHGLRGMRERAALHGGRVDAGPDAAGGYCVHADLPLHE